MKKEFSDQALAEVMEEILRDKIEEEKKIIRRNISGHKWWHKFIPFTIDIKIKRRQLWK